MRNEQDVDVAGIVAIIDDAAQTAMGFFRHTLEIETKGDESPVTVADKTVETRIRAALQAAYPDFGILGEEFGAAGTDREAYWVVDPIDGTRSFISGLPLFGMLLGLVRRGEPELGIVAMPALGEVFVGQKGKGATLNGAPVRTSGCKTLAGATLFINEAEKLLQDEPALLAVLAKTGATRRMAYDCYSHALVAAGHVDVVVDYDLKPYDYLPVVPLVEAAGGCMCDWEGKPLGLESDGRVISAASPELRDRMLALLRENGATA